MSGIVCDSSRPTNPSVSYLCLADFCTLRGFRNKNTENGRRPSKWWWGPLAVVRLILWLPLPPVSYRLSRVLTTPHYSTLTLSNEQNKYSWKLSRLVVPNDNSRYISSHWEVLYKSNSPTDPFYLKSPIPFIWSMASWLNWKLLQTVKEN